MITSFPLLPNQWLFYGNIIPDEQSSNASRSSQEEGSEGSESSEDSEGSGGSDNSGQGSSSGDSQSDDSQKASSGIENIGLAVFRDDRLVGKLSAIETMCHLIVTNELKSCILSVPDPNDETSSIDLYVTLHAAPEIKTDIINGSPYIRVNVRMNARLSSISNVTQKMTQNRIDALEDSASHYLQTQISNYLYKTAKEFHSDIAGTGRFALKHFKTSLDFSDYDWLERYQDAFFEVSSKVSIESGFLLTGT